jgi:hypothetical protein
MDSAFSEIFPPQRNIDVPQGVPCCDNVAEQVSWRNALPPVGTLWRGDGRCGSVADYPKRAEPCPAWVSGKRCGVADFPGVARGRVGGRGGATEGPSLNRG